MNANSIKAKAVQVLSMEMQGGLTTPAQPLFHLKLMPSNEGKTMDIPKKDTVWRHRKGETYTVDRVATHTDTGEWLVVYTGQDGQSWARPLGEFMDGRFTEQKGNTMGTEYIYAVGGTGRFVFDSEQEAMSMLVKYPDLTPTIHRAKKVPFTILGFVDLADIIESAKVSAEDNFGDVAEYWLSHIPMNAREDLGARIDAWATEHDLQPDFYKIEDIEELQVESLRTQIEKNP